MGLRIYSFVCTIKDDLEEFTAMLTLRLHVFFDVHVYHTFNCYNTQRKKYKKRKKKKVRTVLSFLLCPAYLCTF